MRLPANRAGAWNPEVVREDAPIIPIKRRGNSTWQGPCYLNTEAVLSKLADAGALALPTTQLVPTPTRAFHVRSLETDAECVLFVGEPVKP